MKEKIIIALDVSSRKEALALVESLHPLTGMFKVGMQLFTAEGPAFVRDIVAAGGKVFLDLKFHDIPNTVRKAALEAAKLGVSMMTIHASGAQAMMQAVSDELREKLGEKKPLVVGVTVLTSMDDGSLRETGVSASMDEQVLRLAKLAEASGLDGVVCSPREIQMIRGAVDPNFRIVTPGVRMHGQAADDQQRTATPREAISSGADYIVVGRAVTNAPHPRTALESLLQSL
jgi:orotidine-5'-phosphate decarboxylase